MVITSLETKEVDDNIYVHSPEELVPLLREFYKNCEKECFVAIALNTKYKVTSIRAISVGTVNNSIVHPREVFRYAIQENATAVIVSHNHPSGNQEPSENDVKTTETLVSAGKIIGIQVLDHIIIGDDYYSFMKNDLLGD